MSDPHRIRLQAAWTRAAGETAWTRSFGRPSGVGTGDRVWLVMERPAACAAVLNGRHLPAVAGGLTAWRHDVTGDLQTRNELRLEFVGYDAADVAGDRVPLPDSLGAVALEIESDA